MIKKNLAAALRNRQRGTASMSEIMDTLSDDEVIGCYNRCSSCGKQAIPMDDLDMVIRDVPSAGEFILRLESLDRSAPEKAHQVGCPEARSPKT